MNLKDAHNIHPGQVVKVTGPDFEVTGRLGYVEVNLDEEYIEDMALCEAEPTRHLVSREPTVRMTVGLWGSPKFGLYDETIDVEVLK